MKNTVAAIALAVALPSAGYAGRDMSRQGSKAPPAAPQNRNR